MGHTVRLRLYKAVVSAPLSVKGVYFAAGATVGTAEGLLLLTEQECVAVLRRLELCLHETQERCLEHCADLTTRAYRVAGACAGLYGGGKAAARTMWVHYTEDEVTARLMQGSPIKYRIMELRDLISLNSSRAGSVASELHI